jgi:hypothetical protein
MTMMFLRKIEAMFNVIENSRIELINNLSFHIHTFVNNKYIILRVNKMTSVLG